MEKSDTATLSVYLAPEYRHSDVFGEIQHRADWLTFASAKRTIANLSIYDIEILIYDDNIAVVTGKMSYLFGVDEMKQELRVTQLLGNYDGQWKRMTFQATYLKPKN